MPDPPQTGEPTTASQGAAEKPQPAAQPKAAPTAELPAVQQPASQVKADAQAAAQNAQQAAQAKASTPCPDLSTQEKSNSCVIASSRNMIKQLTGKDVPEDKLRGEMNTIINDPNHDWDKNGTNPSNAVKLLNDHGVKAKAVPGSSVSNDDLAKLTEKGKPVMVGFQNPGHRVILDSVTVGDDGKKIFNVKDPARKFGGKTRKMTEDEFKAKRNPKAVVIVPE